MRGLLVALALALPPAVLGAAPTSYEIRHPFRSVSRWLTNGDGSGDDDGLDDGGDAVVEARPAAVKRGLLLMSKTQLMTKGVDGATFHLAATMGTGSAARSG